jgi:hypothetical protein
MSPSQTAVRDQTLTYIEQLRLHAAEANAEGEERRRLRKAVEIKQLQLQLVSLSASPKAVKPLDVQIVELMRTLPPQLRDRFWSMSELVARLSGKYRERPHPQNVGAALLRLGWRKERRYGQGYGGRRLWLPPG